MPQCLFCDIASGKTPGHIVYDTGKAMAFLDIHPLADGHTMVIPKAHYQRLVEMPPDILAEVFSAVQTVARKITAALGAKDFTIGLNDGPGAGQVVPHLHVHIIPRVPGDGGGNIHSIIRRPTRVGLDEMRARLRNAPG